uniref:Uncharacterized protein n=1 Tax=Grammatophora oceanica TaxID=210454 RepID=A0A7S1VPD1_9STRA
MTTTSQNGTAHDDNQNSGSNDDDNNVMTQTAAHNNDDDASMDMEKAAAIENEWNPPIVAATLIPEEPTATLVGHVSTAAAASPAPPRGESFGTTVSDVTNTTTTSSPNLPSSMPSSARDLTSHPDLEIATIEVDGGFTSLEEELNHAAMHGRTYSRDPSDTTWSTDDDSSTSPDNNNTRRRRSKWGRKLKKRKRWLRAATLAVAMILCVAIGAVLATKYAEKKQGPGSSSSGTPADTGETHVDDPLHPTGFQTAPSAAPSDDGALHHDCITEAVPTWSHPLPDVNVKKLQVSQDGQLTVILTKELQLQTFGRGFDGDSILTETDVMVRDYALSADGTTVAVAVDNDRGGQFILFRIVDKSWAVLSSLTVGNGKDASVYNIDLSKDGNVAAFCYSENYGTSPSTCLVYKLDSGDELVVEQGPIGLPFLDNIAEKYSTIEISDDGSRAFLALSGGIVRAFDLVDNEWTQVGNPIISSRPPAALKSSSSSAVTMAASAAGDIVAVGSGTSATVYGFINDEWHQVGYAPLTFNTTGTSFNNTNNSSSSTTNTTNQGHELVMSLAPDGTSLLLTMTFQRDTRNDSEPHLVQEALMFRRTVADIVFSYPLSIELPNFGGSPPHVQDVQLIEDGDGLVVALSDGLVRYDLECMRRLSAPGGSGD